MKRPSSLSRIALIVAVSAAASVSASAQKPAERESRDFCSSNYSSEKNVSYSETREMTLPATGQLSVDGGNNGGVRVRGENRSDVRVRACIQTWGTTEAAAKSVAESVKIGTSGVIKAEGESNDNHWAVSYDIAVPRGTDLNLTAHNGGISIESVEGRLEFETTNGGVRLSDVAGDVKGRTTNGGVSVSLSGNSWKGGGLDVQTTNGGVSLSMPETYAAHVETGTVNGGFKSDIAALNVERTDRSRAARISTDINGGGAPIRVVTTNGGIRISSGEGSSRY